MSTTASTTTTSAQSTATTPQEHVTQKALVHPDDAEVMVRIRQARRYFGAVHALDGIDLDVVRGQFLVLLGPSGSGKSTLIRSLAGIETLDSGTIEINDRLVSGPRINLAPEQRDLGMVFQDYALWPHMTVGQNVAFPLRQRRIPSRQIEPRVREMLARVGLADLTGRYPNELSGGQQQRVALARALVSRPPLVLFDEPLSNLDADLRERLRIEIASLTREQGATAIYITHDQREAFALADRVGVLNFGQLVQWGRPEDIYHDPASSFVARFTGVAGTLPAHVVHLLPNGRCEVELADGSSLVVRAAARLSPSERCEVQVRPSAPSIQESGPNQADRTNLITGTVTDTAYRGALYDHALVGPWGSLTGIASQSPIERGSQCTVRLHPQDLLCFPYRPDVFGSASQR